MSAEHEVSSIVKVTTIDKPARPGQQGCIFSFLHAVRNNFQVWGIIPTIFRYPFLIVLLYEPPAKDTGRCISYVPSRETKWCHMTKLVIYLCWDAISQYMNAPLLTLTIQPTSRKSYIK